jgi:hypothetical protein
MSKFDQLCSAFHVSFGIGQSLRSIVGFGQSAIGRGNRFNVDPSKDKLTLGEAI